MADTIYKVRVQVLGENGEVLGDADVQTSADLVFFEDGQTFQQKLDSGELKGADGATGAKGETGQRGSRWNSGTAITGTSSTATVFAGSGITDALVNDMYLNTETGNVYRCTTAGAASTAKWVYAGNIKGAKGETGAAGKDGADGEKGATGATGPAGADGEDGADGADGATWLFGSSAPASSAGKDGDWYLNTSTWDVYNKASGAWSKKGNIKGATGAQGTQGEQGETGPQGPKGDKGDKGDTGATGPAGPAGADGKDGDGIKVGASYETATERKLFFKIIQ